jgi:hypothetical protein
MTPAIVTQTNCGTPTLTPAAPTQMAFYQVLAVTTALGAMNFSGTFTASADL